MQLTRLTRLKRLTPKQMQLTQLTPKQQAELNAILAPYLKTPEVQQMASYVQHGHVNTLEHCLRVARTSWWIAAHLPWQLNKRAMAVGALLHDFYLYDWHGAGWQHSYRHAGRACKNAVEYFAVDEPTQKVIRSHMWPISPTVLPSTHEARVVCLADKLVSAHETLFCRSKKARHDAQ